MSEPSSAVVAYRVSPVRRCIEEVVTHQDYLNQLAPYTSTPEEAARWLRWGLVLYFPTRCLAEHVLMLASRK